MDFKGLPTARFVKVLAGSIFMGILMVSYMNCSQGSNAEGTLSNSPSASGTIGNSSLIQITNYPSTTLTTANIAFTVGSVPAGVKSVQCQLDSQPALNCSSGSVTFSNLYVLPYTHSITITVTDNANNQQTLNYPWSIQSPGLDQQIAAAQWTAENSEWCTGSQNNIQPFYWEIGTASGPVTGSVAGEASGSVPIPPSPLPAPTAPPEYVVRTTMLGIDSASKFLFSTYVTQGLGNYIPNNTSPSFQTTSAFLRMNTGYVSFQDDACSPNLLSSTTMGTMASVSDCYSSCCVLDSKGSVLSDQYGVLCGTAINHSTPLSTFKPTNGAAASISCGYDYTSSVSGFSYGGGHFQRYGAAGTSGIPAPYPSGDPYGSYGLALGNLQMDAGKPLPAQSLNLAYTVLSALGFVSGPNNLYGAYDGLTSFFYQFPQLAGGVNLDAASYATILQQIVTTSSPLAIRSYLGKDPLCAWVATQDFGACNANYSPINYQGLHYSYGHWVEDEPQGEIYDVYGNPTNPPTYAAVAGDGAFSSPGKAGWYPWVDATKTYYGLIARSDPPTGGPSASSVGSGWGTLLCGRQIRAAFFTGQNQ